MVHKLPIAIEFLGYQEKKLEKVHVFYYSWIISYLFKLEAVCVYAKITNHI